MRLRAQQRWDETQSFETARVIVTEGCVALEHVSVTGSRQIIDFLQPGDVASHGIATAPVVSLRAVTSAALTALVSAQRPSVALLLAERQAQVERINLHKLMIGSLDAEQRLASFIVERTLRGSKPPHTEVEVLVPMSRNDVAEFLAISPATVSRVFTRFENIGLIRRVDRCRVRIRDYSGLARITPLTALLASVFRPNELHARSVD